MNVITGKSLSRRTLLRGAGITLALPFLDAMKPALGATAGSTASAPLRLAVVYVPNGISMDSWRPTGLDKNWELTRILKPLAPHKDSLNVLTGLTHNNGRALGDGPGDHARAAASFLSGVHPKKTGGANIHNGVTMDQLIAAHVGKQTRFQSLELGTEPGGIAGECDSGYSCAYTNSISWRTDTAPNPPETNPRLLFQRLFGDEAGQDPEIRAKSRLYRTSILDYVMEDSRQLMNRVGTHDRRKLDEYLYAIREIERRIQSASDQKDIDPGIQQPSGMPAEFAEHVKLMYDMMTIAMQADLTRVTTFMMGREGSTRTYRDIGISEAHHPLSHHQKDPEKIEKITQINAYHVELFKYFLDRMACTVEGDGSLLDNSLIIYGSGLSDGNSHFHHDLPVLLAGKAKGKIGLNRRLASPKETPMTNLYVSTMNMFGLPIEKFSDSNGKLQELTGLV